MPSASSIAANGATASPLAESRSEATWLRILSGAILAPAVLAAVYVGWPVFDLLVLAAAALMAWEWASVCERGGPGRLSIPLIAFLVAAVVATRGLGAGPALAVALTGVLAAMVLARLARLESPVWLAGGVIYMSLACISALWLRADPIAGRELVLWLFAIVWATDIGAYAVGRSLGRRRLAPGISPNKTWAGVAGGLVAGGAAAGITAWGLGTIAVWPGVGLGLALSVVAQAGDLLESAAKRRFGVKDTGRLIPGHGGLLDRIDSLIAAAPALALTYRLSGGDFLIWR